jgi:hypothetical protein
VRLTGARITPPQPLEKIIEIRQLFPDPRLKMLNNLGHPELDSGSRRQRTAVAVCARAKGYH